MLSELESETQVYWNRREIAAVVLPFMLEEADRQGIDFFAEHSEIFSAAADNLRQRAMHPYPPTLSDSEQLQGELEADADAISRILHSPRVPADIKNDLWDRVCELNIHPTGNADVFRVAYPLAVLELMDEENEGSAGNE